MEFPNNDMSAGMTVTEEYFERTGMDTDAAEEFRRKMERRRDTPAGMIQRHIPSTSIPCLASQLLCCS